MGGLMLQRTSAREAHARKLPSKTASVTGGKPWQRSVRNLWGYIGLNSPGRLSSPLDFAPVELLVEQDVPLLLTDEEGLLSSHLHVLPRCDSGEHRQFLLIKILASAMPPIPFSVFGTFRSETYLS